MSLFVVDNRPLLSGICDILVSGCAPRDEHDGLLHIERTGPFIPPIYISSSIGDNFIVSDSFRATLENADIPSIEFRKTVYAKTVFLPWHTWDLDADEPPWYPESGEPDDYIFDAPHDDKLAMTMEKSWEILLPRPPCNVIETRITGCVAKLQEGFDYPALFYGSQYANEAPVPIVDSSIKEWLTKHAADWLTFHELRVIYKTEVVYPAGPVR